MPDIHVSIPRQPISYVWDDFKAVFSNRVFLGITLAIPIVSLPLILWIAMSPIILVEQLGLTNLQYGLAQVPVLGGLIIGNLVLIKVIERLPVGRTVMLSLPLMLFGAALVCVGLIWQQHLLWTLIAGMTLISFGEGCSFSVLYRFSLDSCQQSKGTVAAAVGMVMMVAFFIIIELVRIGYENQGYTAYALSCLILLSLWFAYPRRVLKKLMQCRAQAEHA